MLPLSLTALGSALLIAGSLDPGRGRVAGVGLGMVLAGLMAVAVIEMTRQVHP